MKPPSFRNPLFSIKDKPAKTKGRVRRPSTKGKAEQATGREDPTQVGTAAPLEQEREHARELFKLELPSGTKEALEKEASGTVVSDLDLGCPLPVFLTEAARVGAATLRYWQPRKPQSVGMVAAKKQIGEAIAAEIAHLLQRFAVVESQWQKASAQQKDETLVRARFVYRELRLATEFVVDGVEDGSDAVFASLARTHGGEPSIPELASALTAFSLFGNDLRDRLVGMDGFDVALLDEALSLAQTLRLRGEATAQDDVASSLRHECDVLLSMIQKRVAKARRAARYVFRNEPQLVREFTSSYARERRRKSRKEDASAPTAPMPPSKEGPTD